MSALPSAPLARGNVTVAGTDVAVRSLTRAEVLHLRSLGEAGDERGAEVYMIARGLDISDEEAGAWWDESDAMAVQKLVTGIGTVSRLIGSDGKAPNSTPSEPS